MINHNSITCKECNHKGKLVYLVPGKALVPIWGRLDGKNPQRGDTLNIVGSSFRNCLKCPVCGFSVY